MRRLIILKKRFSLWKNNSNICKFYFSFDTFHQFIFRLQTIHSKWRKTKWSSSNFSRDSQSNLNLSHSVRPWIIPTMPKTSTIFSSISIEWRNERVHTRNISLSDQTNIRSRSIGKQKKIIYQILFQVDFNCQCSQWVRISPNITLNSSIDHRSIPIIIQLINILLTFLNNIRNYSLLNVSNKFLYHWLFSIINMENWRISFVRFRRSLESIISIKN